MTSAASALLSLYSAAGGCSGLCDKADRRCVRPDMMLLDIGLSGLNGYEVCRRIRAQPWGRDLTLLPARQASDGREEPDRR